MSNSFFNHTERFVKLDTVRAEDMNAVLDSVSSGLDGVETKTNAAVKLPDGETAAALPAPAARVGRVLTFDAVTGAPIVTAVSTAEIVAAEGYATTAATSATAAAGYATSAAGSASSASTSAAEAAASAASIAGGPVTSVNGKTGVAVLNAADVGALASTNPSITGSVTEGVYNLTGTVIEPANGTVQYATLTSNTTFTESIADGQAVTLMVNPATYSITWPTITWVSATGNTAPTLTANVYNCITLFQFGGTLYGKFEGHA